MITHTEIHPADELGNVRLQIAALRLKERRLTTTIVADRELRVGQDSYAEVYERKTATGVETVVLSRLLPTLEEFLMLLKGDLLIIHTETTGLFPARGDCMLSLGALQAHYGWYTLIGVLHGSIRDERRLNIGEEYLRHFSGEGRASSPEAFKVHGITDEWAASKAPFSVRADEVMELLCPEEGERPVLCGHNIPFDIAFINAELGRCGYSTLDNQTVDTRLISKVLWPTEKGSLDALCERLGVDRGDRDQRQDALHDCHLVAKCIPGLVAEIEKRLA
ncbi:exonuclease domain-containing protein [Microvirga sp. Mcv34]|uniref:3'-5' exonuclease n=1 Tax=Microvirga sp. Mcv34 TaxID=2926016 RepID=UPI0021C6A6A2|nr:exonuclease domain-containing protein [Microvirga sp. Mcv34]